jgi:hypothetical protein
MRTIKGYLGALIMGLPVMSGLIEGAARGQGIGFQPVPAPLPSGIILDVTPAVSADRRYVRLTLNPTFNVINGFTNYSVPAAVSGGGAGMNGPIGGLGGAGGLGGLGGATGLRSVELGGTTVAAAAPGLVLGTPAGDPFEQAAYTPQGAGGSAIPPSFLEAKPGARSGNPKASIGRSQRRGASRTPHPLKSRKKSAGSSRAHVGQMPPEVDSGFFVDP